MEGLEGLSVYDPLGSTHPNDYWRRYCDSTDQSRLSLAVVWVITSKSSPYASDEGETGCDAASALTPVKSSSSE